MKESTKNLIGFVLFLTVVAALLFAVMRPAHSHENTAKIEQMLNPVVRIHPKVGRSVGSGTILKVRGKYSYIVTNFHVVEDAVHVIPGKGTTMDDLDVDLYTHKNGVLTKKTVRGVIRAYNVERDIALVRIEYRTKHVAKTRHEKYLRIFDPVWAVGASLGMPPAPSTGMLTEHGVTPQGETYLRSSAPTVFGNSGGALYREYKGRYYYVGMPTMVASLPNRGGKVLVPFLSFAVPVSVILAFMKEHGV